MGHRHMLNTQIVETDNDQGWNYAPQPYLPIARGVSESSSSYPVDSMTIQGGHFPSQWTPASGSNGYSSSTVNGELPRYRAMTSGPSLDPYQYDPTAGNLPVRQDHPSSSNMGGQTVHGVDSGFCDQTIVRGKGPYKRKSPLVAPMCDSGYMSNRYYGAGSSSDVHLPVNPWQEAQSTPESYNTNWQYPPSYGVNNISIGSEVTVRNIRSRGAVDLETDPGRTHLSNSVHASSSRLSDQSYLRDFWGQSLNAPMQWNRNFVSPTADGVTSCPNAGFFSQDPSYVNALGNQPNGSLEIGACTNDVSNRNNIAENVSSNLNRSVRGVRSGYGQRSTSTFRASSSNFCPEYVDASDEGQQMVAKSHPSRHPRPSSNLRLRNVDRMGRNHVSSERYRASTEEGIVVTDHYSYYGSRSMVDQHRDMRLDIDNMSYEELIDLGERIGSVSTGLSDALISKSLTESIHCSSDSSQDDGSCVICLEEYRNMDDVGTLRVCGHDFHVGCIRKWLSMKNLCPICKASAMDDGTKGK